MTDSELGFEFFPSPENDDWDERLASLYAYYSSSVRKWTCRRRELEKAGAPREQCDGIEQHVIVPYREMRHAIRIAIDTGNLVSMNEPRLLDRMAHTNAYLALHADPNSLPDYRRMICPQIDKLPWSSRPGQGDFDKAVWEGKWNAPGDQMPAEITRKETLSNRRSREMDGLHNSGRRLDPVAKAGEQIEVAEQIGPLFRAGEPRYKPPDFLAPMESAFDREAVRKVFLGAGLKPKYARFGVAIVFDGARQKNNPTAWKAIYRRRGELSAAFQKLPHSR